MIHSDTIAHRVVRSCGVRYEFEITRLAGESTQEQLETYRDVFKVVANQVITEHDTLIRSGDELDAPRTIYCETKTPNVVVRLSLSSLRDAPKTLLITMSEVIVTSFGVLVDVSVGMMQLVALGISDCPKHISALGATDAVDYWNGDAAAATAAFDAFVGEAKTSDAFTSFTPSGGYETL